uniref:Holin n=1 Tax=viral metagenome TaxID=1070528 RepID=A0A6M3LIJ5_9ZZZZ
MMKGYVTWIAVAGYAALAVVDILNGATETALTKIGLAIGLLGIGRKIEKNGR